LFSFLQVLEEELARQNQSNGKAVEQTAAADEAR